MARGNRKCPDWLQGFPRIYISRSTASVNCRNEINLALNEGKPFLAVHLEESPLPPACALGWEIYRLFCYQISEDRYQEEITQFPRSIAGEQKEIQGSRTPVQEPKTLHTSESPKASAPSTKPKSSKKNRNMVLGNYAVGVAILLLAWFFTMDSESEIQDESAQKVDHNKTLDLNDTSWKEVGSKTWIVPSAGIEMIWCEPGTFMMGNTKSEFGRHGNLETLHKVTLTKGFFWGKYELTEEELFKIKNRPLIDLSPDKKLLPVRSFTHPGASSVLSCTKRSRKQKWDSPHWMAL